MITVHWDSVSLDCLKNTTIPLTFHIDEHIAGVIRIIKSIQHKTNPAMENNEPTDLPLNVTGAELIGLLSQYVRIL